MAKTFDDWQNLSKKQAFPSVLALSGNEKALIDDAVSTVRQHFLDQGLADFNYDKVSAKSETLDSILAKANSLPMMAASRLVEVQDAIAWNAGPLERLEEYLQSPCRTTVFMLLLDQADARQKFVKMLEEKGLLFRFDHPKEHELIPLIRQKARRFELQMDDEAVSVLAFVVGTDLLMIDRALEKLVLACAGRMVMASDVETQVAGTRVLDAFQLGRAVAIGDQKAAIANLLKLKDAREVPLRLLGMLAWQLRQVLKARLLIDEGKSEFEIGKTMALYGDRLRPVMQAAKRYTTEMHVLRISMLTDLDRELKSSRASPWLWMERTVLDLCSLSGRR